MARTPRRSPKSATAIDRSIGAQVRKLREKRSWTQQRLADALAVTHTQLQKYERGADRLTAGRVKEISSLLDVPVSVLFGDENPLQAPPDRTDQTSTKRERHEDKLLDAFRDVSRTNQRKLLRRAQRLSGAIR